MSELIFDELTTSCFLSLFDISLEIPLKIANGQRHWMKIKHFFSTGNETLCPPGKSSHTGFTPCEGKTRNFEIIRCKYLTLKIWYIYLIYSPNNFAINPRMHYFTFYIHRIIWKNKHTNSHTLWVMKLYKPFFTHLLN